MSLAESMTSRSRGTPDLTELQALLFHEAELLDQRRFEDWEMLFTADGYYWIPMRPDQSDPATELSIIYDDRKLMRTRIERLRHPRIHIQDPPSRTCHFVTNIRLIPNGDDAEEIHVASSLLVHEHRQSFSRSFAGQCVHALRLVDGAWRIASKRIDLVNADDVFDPIAIFL